VELRAFPKAPVALAVPGADYSRGAGLEHRTADMWVEVRAFRPVAPVVEELMGSGSAGSGSDNPLAGPLAEVQAYQSAALPLPVVGQADRTGYSAVGWDSLHAGRWVEELAFRSAALPALEVGRQPAGQRSDSPAAGSDNPVARRYSGRRAGPLDLAASRPKAGIGFPGEEPLPYDRGAFSWFPLAELAAAADALRVSR
jgi:hypothetical protein